MPSGGTYNVMTGKVVWTKDPDDALDWSWDFTEWLDDASGTIASYSFEDVDSALTIVEDSRAYAVVTAIISGGTPRTRAEITCRLLLADGRHKDATYVFVVRG